MRRRTRGILGSWSRRRRIRWMRRRWKVFRGATRRRTIWRRRKERAGHLLAAGVAGVFDHQAAVFDVGEARFGGEARGFFGGDSGLEPEAAGVEFDGGL